MSQTIVLSCPNCTTRFSAPAEKFLPNGRQVRCSQCQHVWFNAINSSDANHITSLVERTATATATPAASIASTQTAPLVTTEQQPEPDEAETHQHPKKRRKKKRRKKQGSGFFALLLWLIALCLLAAILTYIFREPLRRALPQAAPFIDRYTNTVDHTAQGLVGRSIVPTVLEFQNIHYDVKEYDGETAILVEADLVNTSDEEVPAPKVHVRIVDAESQPMHATIIGPEDMSDMIAPKQATRYFVRIPEPPADFDRVLLNIEGQ